MKNAVLEAFRQTSLGKQGTAVDADGRENARRATKASSTARLVSETKKKRAEAQTRREEDRDKAKTALEKEVRRRGAEDAKIAELALHARLADARKRLADARKALDDAARAGNVRRADAAAKLERFHVWSAQSDADLSEEEASAASAALVAEIDERGVACALAVEVSDADTSALAAAEAVQKRRAAEDARRAEADDWYEDSLGYFRASYTEIARRRACADATLKAALEAKMAAGDPEEASHDDAAAMGSDSERAANDATTTTTMTTGCESRERLEGERTRMEADRQPRQERRRAEAEDAMRPEMAEEDARRCDEDMFLWNMVEGSLRITAAAAARLQEAEDAILAYEVGASEQMVTTESICSDTEDTRRVAAQRDVGDTDTDTEDTRRVAAQRDVGDTDTDTEDTRRVAAQRDVGDTETSTPMLRTPAPAPAPESYESKVKSLATKLLDGPLRGLKMPGTQNLVRNDVVESIIATCFARFEPRFAEIIFNSHKTGHEVSLKTLREHLRLVGAAAERALDAFTKRPLCVYYFEAEIGRNANISFDMRYLAFEAFLKESDERTFAKYTGKATSITAWQRALQHLDLKLSGTAVWKDVLGDLKEELEKGITRRLTLTLLLDDFDVKALAGKFKINTPPTCKLSETVLMATVRSVSRDALGGFGTNINNGVGGKPKDELDELGASDESFAVYILLSTLGSEEGMTVAEIADECDLTKGAVNWVMARHGGDDGEFFRFGTTPPYKWRIRRDDDPPSAASAKDKKRNRSEDGRDDDANAALAKRKKW